MPTGARTDVVVTPAPAREPGVAAAPVVAPPGAVVVWYADPRCTPSVEAARLPDPARAARIMTAARLAVLREVRRDGVAPGRKSPCWDISDPAEYLARLEWHAREVPAVSYGLSPRWIRGTLYGKPWEGQAAGISGNPIFVSLAEPGRVDGLHAWEAANEWLWRVYDRLDLTDGPLVSEATSAALVAAKD